MSETTKGLINEKLNEINEIEKSVKAKILSEVISESKASVQNVLNEFITPLKETIQNYQVILEQKNNELTQMLNEKELLIKEVDNQVNLVNQLEGQINEIKEDYKIKLTEERNQRLLTEDKLIEGNAKLKAYELMKNDFKLRPYAENLLSCKNITEVEEKVKVITEMRDVLTKKVVLQEQSSGKGIATPEILDEYLKQYTKPGKEGNKVTEQQRLAGVEDNDEEEDESPS